MKINCIDAYRIRDFGEKLCLWFFFFRIFRLIFISHSSILGIATGGKNMQDMVRVVVDAMGGDNALEKS